MPGRTPMVAAIIVCSALLGSGCGESASDEAVETSSPSVDTTAVAPVPEAPQLTLPEDERESELWIREYLPVYENAYERCGDYVDINSPSFNAARINDVHSVRNALAEEARQTSERAAWVAFHGCLDGISDYPFPIPELKHLQRNP